ncbi:putative nad dependent epimerase dehydratase family protein [Phaeoacremonium minimum UCRPA7]|uniref:Putative nad dependent epimerase dehydratase family protein n=1 Tax=Phaeoacremonium minimum (strain UCR-PA7) TaxID=1286976 RepID=R8B8Y4_PHAM7|nr:putative nad dependent epimerase dehydratase family protein [Phaeoacremonium minimum UCRPA7]EON95742.1 putative nad dependent epimerase dehydratase family protein [Phaeoacremonium minimum UCRPA7]
MMSFRGRYATYPSLEGRVVVISGGAMGIGASMVEHFAMQGSQVIFLDIAAQAATDLIQRVLGLGAPHRPAFYQCDLTDIDGALKPVAAKILADHPKVDGLINNAAGTAKGEKKPTMDITPEDWEASFNVNLRHQFFLTQALMPGLLATGAASVVNMGSISWAIPATGALAYTTCKAAVVGLTRTLAHEFGPEGVRVNSIMPGSIATEREKRDVHTPEYKALVLGRQAIKRLLQPDDIARTALWLIADDSGGFTNQSIVVDGGWI